MPVTSGDRVLIHLLTRKEPEGWTGGVSDQDLIASQCGIGRTHVPRALKPLLDDGLMEESLGRAPGRTRRVKVYSLTLKGKEAAEEARTRSLSMEMRWRDEGGTLKEGTVSDCLVEINHHLTSMSMRAIPLPVLLSLPLESLSWNDVIWTSASLGKGDQGGAFVPGEWRPIKVRRELEGNPFDRDLLDRMDDLLSAEGKVLLIGPDGSGKTEFLQLWAISRKKELLWLVKGSDGRTPLEGGPWDTVVLLGGGGPDMEDLLRKRAGVTDPRGEDWPDVLLSASIVLTTSIEHEVEGPVIRIQGVSKGYFMDSCREIGISDGLSTSLFSSSKGSVQVLVHLMGLEPDEISDLNVLNEEEAVISVLLASRK